MIGLFAQMRDDVATGDLRRDPKFRATAMDLYEKEQTGSLAAGFPSCAFLALTG